MEIIREISPGFVLAEVDIEELHEQPKNARVLSKKASAQLKKNIQKEGHLESVPLCILRDDRIYIISGHHRTRAARGGIVKKIIILLYTRNLTDSQIKAKQLAHNGIQGSDDPQILKEIFLEIDNIDDQIESFVDVDAASLDFPIESLEKIENPLTFINVVFTFLPQQLDMLDNTLLMACKEIKNQDVLYVASHSDWERFKTAMRILKAKAKIIAVGNALEKMCSIVLEHYKTH